MCCGQYGYGCYFIKFFTGVITACMTIWKVWQNLYSCEYFKPYNNLMIIIDIIYKFAGLNNPGGYLPELL